jgi:glutathione S-transferase
VQDTLGGIARNGDPDTIKRLREEYAAGKLKTFFSYLAEKLESNGPYVTGAQLTVADISLYGMVKHFRSGKFDYVPVDYDAQWPVFQTFLETMEGNATFAPYKL